jgi:hypothetical protein
LKRKVKKMLDATMSLLPAGVDNHGETVKLEGSQASKGAVEELPDEELIELAKNGDLLQTLIDDFGDGVVGLSVSSKKIQEDAVDELKEKEEEHHNRFARQFRNTWTRQQEINLTTEELSLPCVMEDEAFKNIAKKKRSKSEEAVSKTAVVLQIY